MLFREELKEFNNTHPYQVFETENGIFRYIISGDKNDPPIILFNGLEIQETWIRYVEGLEKSYRVLLIEYPLYVKTVDELLTEIHALTQALGIIGPIVMGYSDGGLHAQFWLRKFPDDISALILISTLTLDSKYCDDIVTKELPHKRRYRTLFKCIPSALMKKALVSKAASYFNGETEQEQSDGISYLETMVLVPDYKKKFIHSVELLWDGAAQNKFSTREFEPVNGRILLLQPSKDIFTSKDQKKLADLLPDARVRTMRGGHLSVIMCAEEYIKEIKEFLNGSTDS